MNIRKFLIFISLFVINAISAQITLEFQGAETGNTWAYTTTGASASAIAQASLNPNISSGTKSIVVGGNSGGGSCYDGGSGNGTTIENKITFSNLNISTSSNSVRTLVFNWGSRFPVCVGTGWDSGEDLIFVAYHNGVAQPEQVIVTGSDNSNFSIKTHQFTYSVPTCVNDFYFEVKLKANRRDELLFIDDVKLTTPAYNTTNVTVSAIVGNNTVCVGQTQNLSVTNTPNTLYTWSGLPAGASFTTINGANSSSSMTINWGTAVPGTYTISVTPSILVCGVSSSGSPSTITITVSTGPVLTFIGNTTICPGETTTITASGATSFNWSNGLGTNPTITVSPAVTTTYTVTGANGSCNATAAVIVTVSNSVTINIAASEHTICAGQSSTLNATGGSNYTWTPANGLNTTTGATVIVNPTATTTYTVSNAGGSCNATANITITVVPLPILTVTANPIQICAGQTSTLNVTGANNYTWQGNGLNTNTGGTVNATPTSNTTYTVTGLNGNCSATGNISIQVSPLPVVTVTANNNPICMGGMTTLQANGADNYTWLADNNPTTLTGSIVNVSPVTTTNYTVIGNTGTCTGNASIMINVSPILIFAGNDTTICAGNPVTLHAITGGANFSWDHGITDGIPFIPNTTTTYKVTVNGNGCVGEDEITIIVENSPSISFSTNIHEGCVPLTVEFTNTSTNGNGFSWDFGDGTSSNELNPHHTFYSYGCKDITLTSSSMNGCSNSIRLDDFICPKATPEAVFNMNMNEIDESNHTVTMNNSSTNANTYLWNFGDGKTSIETNPTHVFPGSEITNYTIELIAYNIDGCSDTARIVLPFADNPIYYVPNAFTPDGNEYNQTFIPVFTAGFDPYDFHIIICNRWGEIVFESNDHRQGWDGTNATGKIVPDGTYTWKIDFGLRSYDSREMITGHVALIR